MRLEHARRPVTSHTLLTFKLVLVPAMMAIITLASRRWGPGIGGLLTGLPLVAGPTLFFFALEQGEAFAVHSAGAAMVGMLAIAAFCLSYAWLSVATAWFVALPVSWLVFGAISIPLNLLSWSPEVAFLATTCGFAIARSFLPSPGGAPAPVVMPLWDLPLRMAAGAALVLSVTALAARLGPVLSGALIPFPVILAIIVAFAHAQQGRPGVVHFLRGFLPAIWSFVLFCLILQRGLVPLGRNLGFALALIGQTGVHTLIFRSRRLGITRA